MLQITQGTTKKCNSAQTDVSAKSLPLWKARKKELESS